jgi:hypothetical protein
MASIKNRSFHSFFLYDYMNHAHISNSKIREQQLLDYKNCRKIKSVKTCILWEEILYFETDSLCRFRDSISGFKSTIR